MDASEQLAVMNAPSMAQVMCLQEQMAQFQQIALHTEHHFANGMYARELHIPAGVLLIGKIHKHEHLFIVTKGRIAVTTDSGMTMIDAPYIGVTNGGIKRAGLAETDTVVVTIHRTELTDLDAIEDEIIEAEDLRLFDSANRPLTIAQEKISCLG